MKQRRLIRSQIIKAWNQTINEDYCSQRINSERSLQASLWSHLIRMLPKNRRIFIEPAMTVSTSNGATTIFPDIVVCNTREVISVIELKYLPRIRPKHKKDIATLDLIAANRKQIFIANARYRGSNEDSIEYSMAKNILFVWAGVHAKRESRTNKLYSAGHASLNKCYLQLHAECIFWTNMNTDSGAT